MQSPVVEGFQEAKVMEFINPVSHRWEPELINDLFTPQEAKLILSIPLNQKWTEDKVIWPFASSGNYSVISGYKFLVNENCIQGTSSNNLSLHQVLWMKIWEATVPNKVRNFMWRACKNAILAKTNLVHRKVLIESICDHYRASPKTVLHALWECPKLSMVWESDNQWSFRGGSSFSSFHALVQHVIAEN